MTGAPATSDDFSQRAAIIEACLSMTRLGINQGMSGNISVRAGGGMLITPTSTPYEAMLPEDIALVSLEASGGAWSGPRRPSSEWRMHAEILRSRADIGAVVHAHPVYCTALAMLRRGIPPCHYMVATFGGEDVRCAGYETFGTESLSARVLEAMAGREACLIANHGMVACGRDLEQAMWRAVELEALARQYHASLTVGTPVMLSSAQIADAIAQFAAYRP